MALPGPCPSASPQSAGRRSALLDFWRGLVLCIIFVNHVPGNIFECLTPKNFGYSDSAEAFVFLSGVSLALAYGPRFAEGRFWSAVHSLRRRVVLLYAVHILLSLAAVAIYAAGASFGDDESLMDVHGRDLFTDDPGAALLGLLSLGHQLGYFNILPLYIVLIAFFVAQLALARVRLGAMLVVSLAVYGGSRLFGWNIPTWPMKGSWFFDPLSWQLLMAIGIAAVALYQRGASPRLPWLTALAVAVVAASAFTLNDGLGLLPGLQVQTHRWLDLDKTSLGVGRLVHFLALAYLLYDLGVVRGVAATRFGGTLRLFGRHSLAIFATLSLLAAVGQVATTLDGNTALLDGVIIGIGFAALFALARMLEARDASLVVTRAQLGAAKR